jgi:hypothetical protein
LCLSFLFSTIAGHTFGAQAEQFIADIQVHCPRVEFPDCFLGDVVFVTKKFTNRGSTPASFQFRPDPSNIFDIRPTGSCGVRHETPFLRVLKA